MADSRQIAEFIKGLPSDQIERFKNLDKAKQTQFVNIIGQKIDGGVPQDIKKPSINIDGRQDMLGNAFSEMQQRKPMDYIDPRKGLGVAGTNLKALSGLYQRAEAGISNPITGIQTGQVKSPQDAFNQFKAGITGGKLGEYGDIARNSGLPEPVSATLGMGASMALDPIGGLTSKPAQAFGKFLNEGTKGVGVRVMNAVIRTPEKFLEKSTRMSRPELNLGLQALEKDIVGSYKTMLKKISTNLQKTDGAIESFLAGRSETVDAFDIAQSLDDVFKTRTLAGDVNGARSVKKVQDLILNLADPKTGKIGVAKANEFKVALNKLIGEAGFFPKGKEAALAEARKITSGKTADAIEQATQGLIDPRTGKTVAEIQKEAGINLNLRKTVLKTSSDKANDPLITTLDVISGFNPGVAIGNITKRSLASSSIGSRIAKGLYESGKSGFSGILGRIAIASLAEASRKANGLKAKR